MQKSEWSGDLYTLIEFLSNNNENKYLYVDDIKSNPIKINEYLNYLKQIINYIIITPLCIGLIIYILTRNFKSRIEKYLDLLFKSGIFTIIVLFAINFCAQILIVNNFIPKEFLRYSQIELSLGYILYGIYIIICVAINNKLKKN
jgi:predicted Na+-dependent transporter